MLYLTVEAEFTAPRYGERSAEHTACVFEHEIDLLGRDFLSGDNKVTFVLAVFVVDHNHHFSVAEIFNGIFDAVKTYVLIHYRVCYEHRRHPMWLRGVRAAFG